MTATDFKQPAFVRTVPTDALPPPMSMTGALGWARANLFSGPFNILMTILVILLIVWIVPPLLKFLIIDSSCFFFQAEDGIRYATVTGVQTCALPIFPRHSILSGPARCRVWNEEEYHA